jgi:predicted nucleotidyltransferase component of viral defense system
VIPVEEIKEIARRIGVPESTIERDYAQGWLLEHLTSHFDMALKGGTGIRKVYLGDYRFSDDLDFTLLDEYDIDDIEARVKNAIGTAKRESGIDFEEEIIVEETENGFVVSTYFRFLRRTGSPLRIKLDLTRKENEIVLLPLEKRIENFE